MAATGEWADNRTERLASEPLSPVSGMRRHLSELAQGYRGTVTEGRTVPPMVQSAVRFTARMVAGGQSTGLRRRCALP